MKQTYEDMMIEILLLADYPMKAKELISIIQSRRDNVSHGTIRQMLSLACNKSLIYRIKLEGFNGFYCLPIWFNGSYLKDQYKNKIYESKQIQVQRPARSLGRAS